MNRLNKTESAVFLYCRFSLLPKDPFSRVFRGRNSCCCFYVELVKLLPVHRYSVDIFFKFWSVRNTKLFDGKPLKPVLGGMNIVELSISSHE